MTCQRLKEGGLHLLTRETRSNRGTPPSTAGGLGIKAGCPVFYAGYLRIPADRPLSGGPWGWVIVLRKEGQKPNPSSEDRAGAGNP